MEDRLNTDAILVGYLLGQLSEEEQARVEESYFADQSRFEQLELVERELIDSYVQRRLSDHDRQAFEQRFLQSPERRQRIAFARALQVYIEKRQTAQPVSQEVPRAAGFFHLIGQKPWSYAPLAITLLLLTGCLWLAFDNGRLRSRLQQEQTIAGERESREEQLKETLRRQQQEADQLASELEKERGKGRDTGEPGLQNLIAQVVTFNLQTDAVRSSGGIQRLEIPGKAKTIRLNMVLDSVGIQQLEATLSRFANPAVLKSASLKVISRGSKSQVNWSLPASSFEEGDYLIRLSGMDENGTAAQLERFAFRIIRK
jgi:hypothetical protein